MTRYISFLILGFLAFSAQAQNAQNHGYTITGTLNDDASGYAYLEYNYNNQQLKDSTKIVNGEFTFKGKAPEPIFASLIIADPAKRMGFFLENKDLEVKVDEAGNLDLSGSANQEVWKEWSRQWTEKVHVVAGDIYKRLNEAYKKEGLDPAKERLSAEAQKGFDAEFAALNTTTDSILYPLARKYPNSVAIPFIAYDRYIAYNQPEKAIDIYSFLTEEAKNSFYGKHMNTAIRKYEITAIGATAPDFTQNDTTGKPLTLSSLRGKYVFIDFWASWCAPCRKENPNVVKVYEKYHDKGLEILGVSLDEKKDAWLSAIEKDKLTWLHVSDLQGWRNAAAIEYGITTVPATFLLDKEGKVIARDLRGEELEAKLAELLD